MPQFEIKIDNWDGAYPGIANIELSSSEVLFLINLMKEKGTTDVESLDLENSNKKIYQKLWNKCFEASLQNEKSYCLENHFSELVKWNKSELYRHCIEHCGYVPATEDDYEEVEPEKPWDSYHFNEWLKWYLDEIPYKDKYRLIDMFGNIEWDLDSVYCEVQIPETIIKMANLTNPDNEINSETCQNIY